MSCFLFFFNDTATTEIYTLSLHDALPISHARSDELVARRLRAARPRARPHRPRGRVGEGHAGGACDRRAVPDAGDRKSTRLNSSHVSISYAVFCLKKKKKTA